MDDKETKLQRLERELAQHLSEELAPSETMTEEERREAARRRLPSKYELRIQTKLDPIALETKRYRELAAELDNRYDRYAGGSDALENKE